MIAVVLIDDLAQTSRQLRNQFRDGSRVIEIGMI